MKTEKQTVQQPHPDSVYLSKLIYKVFEADETGKELLLKLQEMLWSQPVSPPGCQEGYGFWREGQNDLIRFFKHQIQQHLDYSKAENKA